MQYNISGTFIAYAALEAKHQINPAIGINQFNMLENSSGAAPITMQGTSSSMRMELEAWG